MPLMKEACSLLMAATTVLIDFLLQPTRNPPPFLGLRWRQTQPVLLKLVLVGHWDRLKPKRSELKVSATNCSDKVFMAMLAS